jgi:hypothetical protein
VVLISNCLNQKEGNNNNNNKNHARTEMELGPIFAVAFPAKDNWIFFDVKLNSLSNKLEISPRLHDTPPTQIKDCQISKANTSCRNLKLFIALFWWREDFLKKFF